MNYGSFANVILSETDLAKLYARFGQLNANRRIETLSEYLAAKGKRYKSHYAVILCWARKDSRDEVEALQDDPEPNTHQCRLCPTPHEWRSTDPFDCMSYELSCPGFRANRRALQR